MRFVTILLLLNAVAAPAQIVITEVNSTQTAYAAFVEIRNCGGADVDISGFTITYGNNGSDKVMDEPLDADGYGDGLVLSPGEYFLVLRSQSTFASEYPGVNLNTASDDGDNSAIEFMMHGNIYLNGGADYLVLRDAGGSVADRFGNSSETWTDNHAFERTGYPNSGTSVSAHWTDLGADKPGTPASGNDHSLPVELSLFKGRRQGEAIQLTWTTETEVDNHGFYVLRSRNKTGEFKRISALIAGRGTQSHPHNYCFSDDRVESTVSYCYKLEQVDHSGNRRIYGPVCLQARDEPDSTLSPRLPQSRLNGSYPNPFNPCTHISYAVAGGGEQTVLISIHNQCGRTVKRLLQNVRPAGEYEITWAGDNQHGLPVGSGVYFCRMLTSNGQVSTLKLVKMQ